jgi:hypothetical protein
VNKRNRVTMAVCAVLAALTMLGVGRLVNYWVRANAVTVRRVPIELWEFGAYPYATQANLAPGTRREVYGKYLELGPLEIIWLNPLGRERLDELSALPP